MNIVEYLKNPEKTQFSFELLPPLKGKDITSIFNTVDNLLEFDPKYINITSHRSHVEMVKQADGAVIEKHIRKRPGTVAIAAALQNKYKIPVIPHIICSGFTKDETEYVLIDMKFLGITNLLLLRGDPLKGEATWVAGDDSHAHTTDLIGQVNDMNKGIYLDKGLKNPTPTNFNFGVAGYPEMHGEAVSMDADMKYLKQKVDMGAEYIVTQMFFDNKVYYDFVDKCRAMNINVPIVPGLKPLNFVNQLNVIPEIFHIEFPEPLKSDFAKCKTNEDAVELGVEWGIEQAKDLIENKVPIIHWYTLMAGKSVKRIASAVY